LADQAELDKRYQLQFDGVNKSIAELKKLRDSISEIKREAKARTEEDTRRNKLQAEWEARMQTVIDSAEDVQRSFKSAETGRRQDAKRLADAQGEISALRKRLEDTREKSDLLSDGLRRTETRLNEILASEAERKQAQTAFFENQARLQVERDRMWKEWEENLGSIRKQTQSMDRHLQDWDTIQRAVKRAQETYEEIILKFERRINEITEMQRLAEDRFRQELVSFKADDQKRWTSYTLSQEESLKDARTEIGKVQTRLTQLEDLAQTQQDILQQTKEANQQLFQGLLAQIHELLSAYERIMSVK
jgi:chromosome segregation ATPase